jgi:hypothetical protein
MLQKNMKFRKGYSFSFDIRDQNPSNKCCETLLTLFAIFGE